VRSSFPRRLGCIARKTSLPLTPIGYRRNGRAIWAVEGGALGVSCFNVTNGTDDTDASTYTTAGVTILVTCAYLLSVITSHATAAPIPTIAGAGQTWVQVDTQTFAGGQGRLTTFRCGGLAGSGALTITATAATGCQWILDGFNGVITDNNGGGAIFQEVGSNGTATTATITLGATESASNASYGVWARSAAANEAWTPGAGFTSMVQTGGANPARSFLTEFSATLDTTIDATWTTSATYRAFGFEIRFLDPAKVYGTKLTAGSNTTDASSYATATILPDPNRLVLAAIEVSKASAVPTPTLSGCGLTWVQVGTAAFATTSRCTLFRAMGSAPTSGVVTISAASTTGAAWSIWEFGNVDTSGTNGSAAIVQSNTGSDNSATSATFSITLAAFASANNATYGCVNVGAATTPGAGFTELDEVTYLTPSNGVEVEFKNTNDTTVDWSVAAASKWEGVAVEIKYAPQPKPVVPVLPREALMRSANW
jgi:hypothetical protein